MSAWDSEMQPPPVEVAARFSAKLGDAVREYVARPSDETRRAVSAALGEDVDATLHPDTIDGRVGERRARIAQLLEGLDGEMVGLSEDLAFRKWRSEPFSRYRRATLIIGRRSPKNTVSAAALLGDLREIAASPDGAASGDAPRRTLRVEDFAQPGMRVPPYSTGSPGHEGQANPQNAARVLNG